MTSHDKQILKRMLAQDATLGGVFDAFASRVSAILNGYSYGDGGIWSNNKLVELKVDMEVESLRKNLETHIRNNQQWAWGVSNAKNDELVNSYIKGLAISSALKEGMFARNMEAFEQFSKRKVNGFTVSDRVWDIPRQAKTQLEFYLESGIGNGRSAATLSRDIRQLLKEPEKLFRRVRDKNGNLVPSKPMKEYHPGQGVYRSSYKNALRLSVSEINMSYRNADHERWGRLDFVTGIEVRLSSAHPRTDICDHMKGKYPKDFKFTGWHPFCLCYATPILMDKDRFMDYIDSGDDSLLKGQSVNTIPQPAVSYLRRNQKTIDGWTSRPIWLRDNFKGGKVANGLTSVSGLDLKAPFILNQDSIELLKKRGFIISGTGEKYNELMDGFDLNEFDTELESICNLYDVKWIDKNIDEYSHIVKIRYYGKHAGSNDAVSLNRIFTVGEDGNRIVKHDYFEIPRAMQGQGFSKEVFRALYKQYQNANIAKIEVHANLDVGGLTWAKYGFEAYEFGDVERYVNRAINNGVIIGDDLVEARQFLDEIAGWNFKEKGAYPMYKVAYKPWAKSLLGSHWYGSIDLRNPNQVKVFEDYLFKGKR